MSVLMRHRDSILMWRELWLKETSKIQMCNYNETGGSYYRSKEGQKGQSYRSLSI